MATGPATEKGRVTRQRIVAAAAEVLADASKDGLVVTHFLISNDHRRMQPV